MYGYMCISLGLETWDTGVLQMGPRRGHIDGDGKAGLGNGILSTFMNVDCLTLGLQCFDLGLPCL